MGNVKGGWSRSGNWAFASSSSLDLSFVFSYVNGLELMRTRNIDACLYCLGVTTELPGTY